MNTIETPITKEKAAALVADAFQDSEYFLPKIALQDQLGLDVEVISLKRDPIYSNFSRIGLLDVGSTHADTVIDRVQLELAKRCDKGLSLGLSSTLRSSMGPTAAAFMAHF